MKILMTMCAVLLGIGVAYGQAEPNQPQRVTVDFTTYGEEIPNEYFEKGIVCEGDSVWLQSYKTAHQKYNTDQKETEIEIIISFGSLKKDCLTQMTPEICVRDEAMNIFFRKKIRMYPSDKKLILFIKKAHSEERLFFDIDFGKGMPNSPMYML